MKYRYTFLLLILFITLKSQVDINTKSFYSIERYSNDLLFPEHILFDYHTVNSTNFLSVLKRVSGLEQVEFRFLNSEHESNGQIHYRYIQVVNGIDVLGSMYIAHEKEGYIYSANGETFNTPKSMTVLHSPQEASDQVLLFTPNVNYPSFKSTTNSWLQEITGTPSTNINPNPYLVVLPAVLNEKTHSSRLAFAVDRFSFEPCSRKIYYFDAATLELLYTEDKIETINVPGKANTKYSGVQNIVTDSLQTNSFRLREFSRGNGNGIETYNMQKGTIYTTAIDFQDLDNYWTNYNTNFDEIAGDVHWGSEMTYDFYKSLFNRNSIDNNGFKLISFVHYSNNYVNAFWNGYFMTYGDGGSGYLPLTSLDVCGHEITHGLTQKTAALIYSNESGALNESFSDIFGVSIDFYTRPTIANFRIGEQFGPGGAGLRDMADPKTYQNPSTYKGQFWISSKSDNGGVHYNSGVQNKWFYLLSKGDTGTNDNGTKYKVDSIGFIKAAQISYKNLTTMLTPLSNYEDARYYSIIAAKELYGDCSKEVKQVINAWNAVGVGNTDTSTLASFKTSKPTSCKIPFTVAFYNNSLNGVSYAWDFGDGVTSTLSNPSHTYNSLGNFNVELIATGCNGITIDSTIQNQCIKIAPGLGECALTNLPITGIGVAITSCNGIMRDGGDTSSYSNLSYSIRSIIPTNASSLILNFNMFDYENQFDFLYIYDGPDTLSRLIGKFTGNSLPLNGKIICNSGAATIRHTSDYLAAGKGFELNWQCIPKTNIDYKLSSLNTRIFGRKFTSSALSTSEYINVNVQSNGLQTGNTTILKYQLNTNSIQSKTISLSAGNATEVLGPFDLNAVGSGAIHIWIDDALDGVKENDSLKIDFQQVDNAPVTLPVLENFDAMSDVWLYSKTNAVGGNPRVDYENTSTQNRLRTYAFSEVVTGVRSITFDKSDRNWLFDTIPQTNYLILTYNMSNIAKLYTPLLFRFVYMQHGDKQYPNDAVWVRGCDTCAWIKFFDLFANKAAVGINKTNPLYNLNYYLDSAKQSLTSSFQIRIGQQDQNSTINTQQYTGYTFDNIRFSTWNAGINQSSQSDEIGIYPNPSTGLVTFYTNSNFNRMTISTIDGKKVAEPQLPQTPYFELDLSTLAKGMYIIELEDFKHETIRQKLILR